VRRRLAALWPQLARPLLAALDARGRDRTDPVRKQLADCADDETAKITAILREREAAIREGIGSPLDPPLALFTDAEREQEARNRDFLAGRLAELPAELSREKASGRCHQNLFGIPRRVEAGVAAAGVAAIARVKFGDPFMRLQAVASVPHFGRCRQIAKPVNRRNPSVRI